MGVGYQVSWLRQMSNNDYGKEKASRINCIWCFSLSELGTINVCSSCFITFLYSLSFSECTHKQRWHKCLWWIFTIAWDDLFWVSLQSSPSFSTWGLQHVLHLKCLEVTAGAGHSCLLRKGNFPSRKYMPPALHDLHCLPGCISSLSHIWSINP